MDPLFTDEELNQLRDGLFGKTFALCRVADFATDQGLPRRFLGAGDFTPAVRIIAPQKREAEVISQLESPWIKATVSRRFTEPTPHIWIDVSYVPAVPAPQEEHGWPGARV